MNLQILIANLPEDRQMNYIIIAEPFLTYYWGFLMVKSWGLKAHIWTENKLREPSTGS